MRVFRCLICAAVIASACTSEPVRTMAYYPDGRDIVCLNGDNRYSRALYGTNTLFRLETSDRPVFAVYDKKDSYNFQFLLDGMNLEEAERCEARYRGGLRSYILSDSRWGSGILSVNAIASYSEEGAIWEFVAEGFDGDHELTVVKSPIADTHMVRGGDYGMDGREKFEASQDAPKDTLRWAAESRTYCIYHHKGSIELTSDASAYAAEEQSRRKMEERVVFDTPDPFINTLGSCLTAAADGTWDSATHTWLHGAIGWRTPLAGWRGAYAGDVLGWSDRSREHFEAYLASMVTDVPQIYDHPQQDSAANLCRAEKKWGTPMYSNGYICRQPGRKDVMNHYDMNLNFIDELLAHVSFDADTSYLRHIWPYLQLHHEWEKRNFDPDGDHLYDAYCCIWASDALYYNSGAVTHSSAYNYRSNLLTARIAELLGEDPKPYRDEAEAILEAMDSRLWLPDGHWAEFEDMLGHGRIHESAALWSVYTPIECESCTPAQAWLATRYVDTSIPHIPVHYEYDRKAVSALGLKLPKASRDLYTLSTTNWLPYVWSTNNVAHAEVTATAFAYFLADRPEEGFKILKADILDQMYLSHCPGNFGQISWYDKARSEAYRDFADNVGVSARALVSGLFGILPDALNGRCVIKPSFPADWDHASIRTPFLSYSFHREGSKDIYEIEQHFASPLKISVRACNGLGSSVETAGNSGTVQTIVVDRSQLPKGKAPKVRSNEKRETAAELAALGLSDIKPRSSKRTADISAAFNANVDDIFRVEYLSPRSPYTTLSLPKQGVGEWCVPDETHEIEDDGFRARISDGTFDTGLGLSFLSPAEGHNVAYVSLWDNFPDSISVALEGSARAAYLLMAGTTNNMQSRIANGIVRVSYTDGSSDVLELVNPLNWCPIEQDYYTDAHAFRAARIHPYRVLLADGRTGRDPDVSFLAAAENGLQLFDAVKATDKIIPGGAAQILRMPLDKHKKMESLTLEALSNDVVIGLMAVTLEN